MSSQLEKVVEVIRERVEGVSKRYGSLSNYGRPIFESLEEVAVVYYLYKKMDFSALELSKELGLDKTSVYKLLKRVEEDNRVSYFDPQKRATVVVNVRPEDLISIVEESVLKISSKQKIVDPMLSDIIQKFMREDIERQSGRDRRVFYTEKEKLQTVKVVSSLMQIALQLNLPSNPDFWDKNVLLKILDTIEDKRKRRNMIKLLRRIPAWRAWLEGYVMSEKKFINPKLSVIFYEHYLQIKDMYRSGELSEADFLTIWLHLTTGAREGYKCVLLEDCTSSLAGLKWENLSALGDTYVLKVYENKTQKWWSCDLGWLDPEPISLLLKYRREKGSIIKTLTGFERVNDFFKHYAKVLSHISKKLGLGFELTPHDIRRSHLSILSELGVPLEIAVTDQGYGVGWEDLSTAVLFYLRFSKHTRERILSEIRERQREIENHTRENHQNHQRTRSTSTIE